MCVSSVIEEVKSGSVDVKSNANMHYCTLCIDQNVDHSRWDYLVRQAGNSRQRYWLPGAFYYRHGSIPQTELPA